MSERLTQREIDAQIREAELDLLNLQRMNEVWQLPLIPDRYVHTLLDCSPAGWHDIKRSGDAPPSFNIGRRRYVTNRDARKWVEEHPVQKRLPDEGAAEEEGGVQSGVALHAIAHHMTTMRDPADGHHRGKSPARDSAPEIRTNESAPAAR